MTKLPDVGDLGAAPQLRTSTDTPLDRTANFRDQNPGAGLEALGRGLQVAGTELWDLKEKTDTIKVEDAWNQYRAHAQNMTVGDKGLLTTVGGDAVNGNLLDRSHQGLTAARSAIMESLTPDQKRRFASRADVTDMETTRSVLTHITQQQFAYGKTVFEGNDAAARNQIVSAPTDPGVFESAQNTLMAQADTYAKQMGADKNSADELKRSLVDGLWKARVEALLPTNPALADSLLRANLTAISNPVLRDTLTNKASEAAQGVTVGIDTQKLIDTTRERLMQAPTPAAPGGGGSPQLRQVIGAIKGAEGSRAQDTSVQGARGTMQITRDTFNQYAKPGESFDKEADRVAAAERKIAADYEFYGGDVRKTAAAYIGGRGAVRADGSIADVKDALGTTAKGYADSVVSRAVAKPVAYTGEPAYTPANTTGQPSHRDIAAQLPIMEAQIEKMANDRYGPDPLNPLRARYIRLATTDLQAKVSRDVQALNYIEKENQGVLLDAVLGMPSPNNGSGLMNVAAGAGAAPNAPRQKITSFEQIAADPRLLKAYQGLDVQAKIGIDNMMTKNLAAEDKGDYVLYRTLFNRVNLPAGTPGKINFYNEITDPAVANRLSVEQIGKLRQEIDRWSPAGGKTWNEIQKYGDAKAEQFFKTNIMFTAQPDRQIAATMRWNEAAQAKIDEYVTAKKDVRTLFQVGNPDSIVDPKYLQTFVDSTPAQGLAEGAAAVKAGGNPVNIARAPATIKSAADADAWIKTLPPTVTSFVDPSGQVRLIPGRQPGAAPAAAAPGAVSPQAQVVSPTAPNVSDLQVNPAGVDRTSWEPRGDGTAKGLGFLGLLKTPDGRVASEYTIGVPINGKETDIPTLVPTLTRPEVEQVLKGQVTPAIRQKAETWALDRVKSGKPVFATDEESPAYQGGATMDATGKLVQPASEPAPAAAQGARTADSFQIVDRPDTVAGNVQAIRQARETAMAVRNQDIEWNVRQNPLEMIRSLKRGIETMGGGVRSFASMLQGKIPTELESIYNGFDAIKESGKVSRQDADVLRQALKYGLLNADDERLANGLLQRISAAPKKK